MYAGLSLTELLHALKFVATEHAGQKHGDIVDDDAAYVHPLLPLAYHTQGRTPRDENAVSSVDADADVGGGGDDASRNSNSVLLWLADVLTGSVAPPTLRSRAAQTNDDDSRLAAVLDAAATMTTAYTSTSTSTPFGSVSTHQRHHSHHRTAPPKQGTLAWKIYMTSHQYLHDTDADAGAGADAAQHFPAVNVESRMRAFAAECERLATAQVAQQQRVFERTRLSDAVLAQRRRADAEIARVRGEAHRQYQQQLAQLQKRELAMHDTASSTVSQAQAERMTERTRFLREIEQLQRVQLQLQQQCALQERETALLEQRVREKEATLDRALQQCTDTQAAAEKERQRLVEVSVDPDERERAVLLSEARAALLEERDRAALLADAVERLSSEAERLQDACAARDVDVHSAREECDTLRGAHEQLTETHAAVQSEAEQLRVRLDTLQRESEAMTHVQQQLVQSLIKSVDDRTAPPQQQQQQQQQQHGNGGDGDASSHVQQHGADDNAAAREPIRPQPGSRDMQPSPAPGITSMPSRPPTAQSVPNTTASSQQHSPVDMQAAVAAATAAARSQVLHSYNAKVASLKIAHLTALSERDATHERQAAASAHALSVAQTERRTVDGVLASVRHELDVAQRKCEQQHAHVDELTLTTRSQAAELTRLREHLASATAQYESDLSVRTAATTADATPSALHSVHSLSQHAHVPAPLPLALSRPLRPQTRVHDDGAVSYMPPHYAPAPLPTALPITASLEPVLYVHAPTPVSSSSPSSAATAVASSSSASASSAFINRPHVIDNTSQQSLSSFASSSSSMLATSSSTSFATPASTDTPVTAATSDGNRFRVNVDVGADVDMDNQPELNRIINGFNVDQFLHGDSPVDRLLSECRERSSQPLEPPVRVADQVLSLLDRGSK